MPKRIDLTDKIFGRLTVKTFSRTDEKYQAYWNCACECSPEVSREVLATSLIHNRTKSCGCLLKDSTKSRFTTHGMSRSSEYHIWAGIKSRCEREDGPQFAHYGGRSIRLFPAWVNDFAAFYAYVGARPSMGHTIDRISNSKGYEPGNVKWATDLEQARNKTSNHLIEKDGISKPLSQWAQELSLSESVIRYRITNDWAEENWLLPVGENPAREGNFKHGESYTPEYEAWHAMKTKYAAYVCPEWLESPEAFIADVGKRPFEADVFMRIDAKKPWAIDNVKWATRKEKQRNMASNKYVELNGERKTVAEWAERHGIDRRRLAQRLRQGWELRDALVEPFRTRTTAALAASG